MSGSLGAVDVSIPLRAGQGGATPPPNPLETISKFVGVSNALNQGEIQKQQIQSGKMSLAQQLKQLSYAHLAPAVQQGRINSMADLTGYLGALEHHGINTQPILQDIARTVNQGGDFISNLKAQIVAGTQPPEKAIGALSPTPSLHNVGGQDIPLLTPAPGMPGQGVPLQSGPGFERGYTPSETLGTTTRPATQDDVDKSGGRLVLGQQISVPTTTIVAPYTNPGRGGSRIPQGALGPGGYAAPQKPLDQLGKPYQPAGAPPHAASPIPGARLMKGPGGSFWVTPDKVPLFQQNGYQ